MKSIQLSHMNTEEPFFQPRVTEYSQTELFEGNMNHGNDERILHKYSQPVLTPEPDSPSLGSSSVSEIQWGREIILNELYGIVDTDMITESSCGSYNFFSLVTAYLLKAMPPFPRLLLHSRANVRETATAPQVSLSTSVQLADKALRLTRTA